MLTRTARLQTACPAQRKRVRPSLPDSYERLFHDIDVPQFLLRLDDRDVRAVLSVPRLERAIGVIYRPDTERLSFRPYFDLARLLSQRDIEHAVVSGAP